MGQLESPQSMAPAFLVAMPQLVDPNFVRSVVLLAAHGPDGGMGFVVNRRLPATVKDVLDGLDVEWKGAADVPVYGGGPVQPQSGWVLYEPDGERRAPDSQELAPGLCMTASIAALRELARKPPRRFRLFLGYSGWGNGQLESEVLEGSWFLAPPSARTVFDVPCEETWSSVFREMGLDPFQIVPGHGVQ